MKKEEIIAAYDLQPHPEGGFFKETYRSELSFDTPAGKRSASTVIKFLITKDSISHLHRLTADEGWHFYLGEYSFVGCTVSPGFDFADFEMGKKENLLNDYPQHKEIIEKYSLE